MSTLNPLNMERKPTINSLLEKPTNNSLPKSTNGIIFNNTMNEKNKDKNTYQTIYNEKLKKIMPLSKDLKQQLINNVTNNTKNKVIEKPNFQTKLLLIHESEKVKIWLIFHQGLQIFDYIIQFKNPMEGITRNQIARNFIPKLINDLDCNIIIEALKKFGINVDKSKVDCSKFRWSFHIKDIPLINFQSKVKSFFDEFIEILKKNNIRKDDTDNFYYYYNPGGYRIKYTWINIKEIGEIELLKKINELRRYFVDNLIRIIEETEQEFCTKKTNTFSYCSVVALGSKALTSNYDVNISSFMAASDIVHLFNSCFFLFWNDTSGEIFDTNLYGNSFFIATFPGQNLNLKYNSIQSSDGKTAYYLPPTGITSEFEKQFLAMQTRWLVIKSFLYEDDNTNTKSKIREIYDNIRKVAIKVIKKLSGRQNNSQNNSQKYLLEYQSMKMKNNSKLPANEYRNRINQKYYECLKQTDALRKIYLDSSDPENLLKLIDSISFSNFYGNETYFCIGTIYHVLGYVQNLARFFMYAEYFIQSMIENFLDIFRNLEHFGEVPAFFKSTKYIFRVYDAIERYYALVGSQYANVKKQMFANMLKQYQTNINKVKFNHNRIKTIYQLGNSTSNADLLRIYGLIFADIETTVNHYLQNSS
jgi:hypothetical protein